MPRNYQKEKKKKHMAHTTAFLLNHAYKLEHSHAQIETSQVTSEIKIWLFISGL